MATLWEELRRERGTRSLSPAAIGARSKPRERQSLTLDVLRWPGVVALLVVLLLFGWCVWRYALRGRLVIAGEHGSMSARGAVSRSSL